MAAMKRLREIGDELKDCWVPGSTAYRTPGWLQPTANLTGYNLQGV